MYLESYPTTKNWNKSILYNGASVINHPHQQLIFLYIRNHADQVQFITKDVHEAIYANGVSNAKKLLEDMIRSNARIPDAIIFDIPLNETELKGFCGYLGNKASFSSIPVFYNQKYIDVEKGRELRKNDLIDDVINMQNRGTNYAKKVLFLKKIKSQATSLQVSAKQAIQSDRENSKPNLTMKRAFDFTIALLIILACLPLFLLVAIAIRVESKGPVFYTSLRAGKGFKIFSFFKFRTMEVGADKKIEALSHLNQYGDCDNGVKFLKIYNDPRVTKVGKILRRTSLDELPQLFNVLRGDMSLVGNRPLPIYEANTLTTNEFVERFMAPAGITGLWQIKKKDKPDMTAEERVNLDISYARHYSLIYDFKIIVKTPAALFQKTNA